MLSFTPGGAYQCECNASMQSSKLQNTRENQIILLVSFILHTLLYIRIRFLFESRAVINFTDKIPIQKIFSMLYYNEITDKIFWRILDCLKLI